MTQATLFDKTPLVYKDEHFTEEQKVKSRKSAESQEARIMAHWSYNPKFWFTASDLWVTLRKNNEPLTSFRRALTNLTKQGKIEKVNGETGEGFYGKPEHYWRLKRDDA